MAETAQLLASAFRRPVCALAVFLALGISVPRAEEVTVFAAASTANAMTEVAELYAASYPAGGEVRSVFAASSTLAMQIHRGAPADLFLSASRDWMDYLAERGAIDPASRLDLLGNRLVLIVPADSRLQLAIEPGFALAAALGRDRLAIGDPAHVPAGIYAKSALEKLGAWPAVAGKTAQAANARAALALVDRGNAAAGIVYQSDAAVGRWTRVAAVFPADSHPAIVYPLALVGAAGSPQVERFYRFLQGPEAAAVFRKHGFLPAPPGD